MFERNLDVAGGKEEINKEDEMNILEAERRQVFLFSPSVQTRCRD